MVIIFSDTSESEETGTSPDNFTITNGSGVISEDWSANGDKSIKITSSSIYGTARHAEVSDWSSEPLLVTFTVKTARISHRIITTDDDLGTQLAYVLFRVDGPILYYDVTWRDTGYTWEADTDYTVKIQHDIDADTYSCWVNDVEIFSDVEFHSSATASYIKAFKFNPNPGVVYYDDVYIGESAVTSYPALHAGGNLGAHRIGRVDGGGLIA